MKSKEVRLLSKWAYKGDVTAQYEYGCALVKGEGCTRNIELGLCFLSIAAENGSDEAKKFLDSYLFEEDKK